MDTEYRLDQTMPDDTNQEKVYYSLGLPAAREAMELLKQKRSDAGVQRTTNLIVCLGVEHSGKTHTCFGAGHGSNITKRRSADDGLVPRILDSLFSQSTHHVKSKRHVSFGVRMSLLQVTQERSEQPKHYDDSVVQDLLQASIAKDTNATPPKHSIRSPSPSRMAAQSVKKLMRTFENATSSAVAAVSTTKSQQEFIVSIDQDVDSMDFTTNALVKTCYDITESRKLLASGLQMGQRLCPRNSKSHVLAILQPVLLKSDGSAEQVGGTIGVFDMAGIEQSSQKKRNTAARHPRDSVGASSRGQSDLALNAVLHCIRSLQHNSMILSGKTPGLDIVGGSVYDGLAIDDCTSEISCVSQEKTGTAEGPAFKVVPYRQHNVTMLLQPFFSARETKMTKLTLLMAAYPGHRDHAEKKTLLNDIKLLMEVSRESDGALVDTGLTKKPLSPIPYSPASAAFSEDRAEDTHHKSKSPRHCYHGRKSPRSPRFERSSENKKQKKAYAALPSAPLLDGGSMAYSMDEDENVVPLAPPPPFAPLAPAPCINRTSVPTAPSPDPAPMAPLAVDFPGVVMPSATNNAPYSAPRAVMPHPQDLDRSFDDTPAKISASQQPQQQQGHALQPTTVHNMPGASNLNKSPTTAWLSGTKNAIRDVAHVSSKTGMKMIDVSMKKGLKMMDKIRTTPDKGGVHSSQSRTAESAPVRPLSETKVDTDHPAGSSLCTTAHDTPPIHLDKMGTVVHRKQGYKSEDKIKLLERENRNLAYQNKALETRCASLESENKALKQQIGDSKRKAWNKDEEEAWEKSKKQFVPPPLIQPPVIKHVTEAKRVFETTGRYNFAVGQEHFSLNLPSNFQRASDLDRRDQLGQDDRSTVDSSSLVSTLQSSKTNESSIDIMAKRLEAVKSRKSSHWQSAREK